MTPKEIIQKFLEGIRTDAIADLQAKNISQGDLGMAVTLLDKDTGPGGQLTGAEYWYYLVHGRRPGKQPPIDSILGWLRKRGIESPEITQRSLAFLVARKIGRLGTDIYLKKRPGLALPAIIESRTQGFEEDIAKFYHDQIDATIISGLDAIFKPLSS